MSDSDDSLTRELEQIGTSLPKIQLSMLSEYNFVTNLPNFPSLSTFTNLGDFDIRNVSRLSLEISNYIRSCVTSLRTSTDNVDVLGRQLRESLFENDDHEQVQETTLVNSLKTIISSRIQMNSLREQLNLGDSLYSAIERLQPLRDIIHETIILPTEDENDEDEATIQEDITEPTGIAKVINQDKPFLNDFILPEGPEREAISNRGRDGNKVKISTSLEHILSPQSILLLNDIYEGVDGLSIDETRDLTSLNSLEDFNKQDLMRLKIKRIHELSIDQDTKNKLMTKLMTRNYYRNMDYEQGKEVVSYSGQYSRKGSDVEDEVILTDFDKTPSYYNKEANIFGCEHYQRNCKIECSICQKWFVCRFCHDEAVKDHKLIRHDIKHIICMYCSTPQEPNGQDCIECEKELANYFCSICKLYDNDYNKDIYHCEKCGICRLGLGLGKDYFHCDECNICLSINLKANHKCVVNTTHCNCPICEEYLFTSSSKVVFMKCGHLIHESCYKNLIQHGYKCPLCKKTIVNMDTQFRILNQEILQQPLPLPYSQWTCIISCNDCKGKSNVLYHVLGLKCKYCHSYNTNQLKLIKPEDEVYENHSINDQVDLMSLIPTNLSNNFLIDDNTEREGMAPNLEPELAPANH